MAETANSRKSGEESNQFLTFAVDGEEYGVDIMRVREIKGWSETTRLPNAPECQRGVMNLRGVIVPIFDLRARFGHGLTEAQSKHVVIILAVGERTIGLLVDAVSDILTVNAEEIKPAPSMHAEAGADYIAGLISVQERMVVILDPEPLFIHELKINDSSADAA